MFRLILQPCKLLLFLMMGVMSWAQPNQVEWQARQLSAYYESVVRGALGSYYHPSSYRVDARVTLKDMVIPLNGVDSLGMQPLLFQPEQRNPDRLNALPGLPVLPETMRMRADAGQPEPLQAPDETIRQELGIKFVDLTILVDTVYNMEDVDFILELVRMAAKLDDFRGDRINVRKKVFPRGNRSIMDHRIHNDTTQHPVLADTLVAQEGALHPWAGYWNDLPSLLPLLVILIFMTLIVWLVTRAMRSSHLPDEWLRLLEAQSAAKEVPSGVDSVPEPVVVKSVSDENANHQLELLRTKAINVLIGGPAMAGTVLRHWIETDRDSALPQIGLLLHGLDAKAIKILKPHLSSADMQQVLLHYELLENPEDKSEMLGVLRLFIKDVINLRHQEGDLTWGDIFGFMKQLSPQQLQHILKEEEPGIIGLALAQIPGDQASVILQSMDNVLRSQVLVAMGQIDLIPVQAYKDVANRLSGKALEVGNMRFVAADGVKSVLDVVQTLGLHEQEEYIQAMAERDIHLVNRIRRFYALFDELPGLPENVLVKVIDTFERERFIDALVETTEEYRDRLLAIVPQRMRQSIESGLEGRIDLTPGDIETARKALLTHVRQVLQKAGGREV